MIILLAAYRERHRVQVDKEVFLWHSEGVKQEEELREETVFKAEVANVDIVKEGDGEEDEEEAFSDTGLVVVEMINFF